MFTVCFAVVAHDVLLSGLKPDGSVKLRVVYNLTGSGVNAATVPTEKLRVDTLDAFLDLIVATHALCGVGSSLRCTCVLKWFAFVLSGFAGDLEGGHRQCVQETSVEPIASRSGMGGMAHQRYYGGNGQALQHAFWRNFECPLLGQNRFMLSCVCTVSMLSGLFVGGRRAPDQDCKEDSAPAGVAICG